MSDKVEIQDLLDLYLKRKNAQGGAVQLSSLQLISLGNEKSVINLQGITEGRGYTVDETRILAQRLFRTLNFEVMSDGNIMIEDHADAIIENLVNANNNVAMYPHTELFQAIMNKVGLYNSANEDKAVPIFMPYPIDAYKLSQFQQCDLSGFHVYSPNLIDNSSIERGIIIEIPFSKYWDDSRREANASVLALHRMGLKLPFPDYVIDSMERKVFDNSTGFGFPDSYVPVDGRVGFTTLASYESSTGWQTLRLAIMEDEDTVLERLQEFVNRPALFASPVTSSTLPHQKLAAPAP